MKSLVLAEKPSVARDIARVLGCHKNISGAIEGSNYIITWALGHLVTLADPEEYDKKFKAWDMSYLPMVPKKWELVVIKQTSKQYHNVKHSFSGKMSLRSSLPPMPDVRENWLPAGSWTNPAVISRSAVCGSPLLPIKRSKKGLPT